MFSRDEVEKVARELDGHPKLIDVFEHPDFALIPGAELIEVGYKVVAYPMTGALACTRILTEIYGDIKKSSDRGTVTDRTMTIHHLEDLLGPAEPKRIAAGLNNGGDS